MESSQFENVRLDCTGGGVIVTAVMWCVGLDGVWASTVCGVV